MDTFAELIRRFTLVQGVPFRELADSFGLDIGTDPRRMKQFAGNIIERVAGKAPDSASSSISRSSTSKSRRFRLPSGCVHVRTRR